MKNNKIEKDFPNLISDYRNEIKIFLSDSEKNRSWLDIAEQMQEDFKSVDFIEYRKLEKIFDKSLDMVGKNGSHYNLTHLEIVFFLYQFWKEVSDDCVLHNKNKLGELNIYINKFDQQFFKYKKTTITPVQEQILPWWKKEIGSWWQLLLILLILRFMLIEDLIQSNSIVRILEILFWWILIIGIWKIIRHFYPSKK